MANERLREMMDKIPEHITRNVELYTALLIKVNKLKSEATEEQQLAIDKLMNSDKFFLDFANIAKLESILGVHLIEVL